MLKNIVYRRQKNRFQLKNKFKMALIMTKINFCKILLKSFEIGGFNKK